MAYVSLGSSSDPLAPVRAALDLTKRTPAAPRTKAEPLAAAKAEAIAAAVAAAKAKIAAQVLDMRQKGIADAKAGRYAAPAPTPPPDFNTMNYQAGWMSTGAALPPGVVLVGAGGVPVGKASGSTAQNKMLLVGGVVGAAVLLLLVLKR